MQVLVGRVVRMLPVNGKAGTHTNPSKIQHDMTKCACDGNWVRILLVSWQKEPNAATQVT